VNVITAGAVTLLCFPAQHLIHSPMKMNFPRGNCPAPLPTQRFPSNYQFSAICFPGRGEDVISIFVMHFIFDSTALICSRNFCVSLGGLLNY